LLFSACQSASCEPSITNDQALLLELVWASNYLDGHGWVQVSVDKLYFNADGTEYADISYFSHSGTYLVDASNADLSMAAVLGKDSFFSMPAVIDRNGIEVSLK